MQYAIPLPSSKPEGWEAVLWIIASPVLIVLLAAWAGLTLLFRK